MSLRMPSQAYAPLAKQEEQKLNWHQQSLRVQIELTTGCNLRCIYCALSDPGYTPHIMSDEVFYKIVDMCVKARVRMVNVAGHGESTNLPDWNEKIQLLLSHGFPLQITTNVALPWSWEEADLMSRFVHVMVSLDTVDQDLLRRLRRKVDLRTIIHNITLLRSAALLNDRPIPRLAFTCVLSDQSVQNLDRLVALAKSLECELNLSNLIELHGVTEDPPRSLFSLSGAELAVACAHYQRALELAHRLKVPFNVHPNLSAYLAAAPTNHFNTDVASSKWDRNFPGCTSTEYHTVSDLLTPGETRDCMDPWNMLYFAADGAVHQCCLSHLDPIGQVSEVDSIDALFASARSVAYRRGLLTGKPVGPCITCIGRGRTSTRGLNAKITNIISDTVSP